METENRLYNTKTFDKFFSLSVRRYRKSDCGHPGVGDVSASASTSELDVLVNWPGVTSSDDDVSGLVGKR